MTATPVGPGRSPNVVWISLESVRADHTSPGGYRRDTTPNLRRIVDAGGVWFPETIATARWTPAVSASVLTGTYQSTHRVGWADTRDVQRVPDALRTLPERLADVGYRTALFSSNPYVSPATGLDRGFERVHRPPTRDDLRSVDGARTAVRYARTFLRAGAGATLDPRQHKDCVFPLYQTETLKSWLREFERDRRNGTDDRPYFLYTHMNSSHHPYNPPRTILRRYLAELPPELSMTPEEAYERAKAITDNIWETVAGGCEFDGRDRAALMAVYDAEIELADRYVGELFDLATASGEPTVFVVAGDHGELFGEQGMLGHNVTLHDGLVRVPLVVYGIDGVDVAADGIVQPLDVTHTVAAAVGADVDGFQGVDLRATPGGREYALMQRGPRRRDLDSIRAFDPDFDAPYHVEGVDAVRSREWKYCRSTDRVALYRLPDEETDVAAAHPDVVARLDAVLDDLIPEASHEAAADAAFSDGMRRQLADLGYL